MHQKRIIEMKIIKIIKIIKIMKIIKIIKIIKLKHKSFAKKAFKLGRIECTGSG